MNWHKQIKILKRILSVMKDISLKTIYFNLKYLPFHQAVYLPIFLSRHVYLMNMKGKIVIEGPVKSKQIKIGFKGVGIFDHKRSRSILNIFGDLVFCGEAFIGHGSKISIGKEGKIIFGNNFRMSAESSLASRKGITFGDNCLVSWDTLIIDTDYHKIYDEDGKQLNENREILIGNNVWIGCRCLILKGAKIPSGCVIGANSVVNARELSGENKIFGGQPVKELKNNITWEN